MSDSPTRTEHDKLATECVVAITELGERLVSYGAKISRNHGIPSPGGFNALAILHFEGQPLQPSAIAERMIITRGGLTGILRTLERHGLIRRHQHPVDGRAQLIELTAGGRRRIASALAEFHRAEARWMEPLDLDERRLLLELVTRALESAPDRQGNPQFGASRDGVE
jgi:DNA-binding MarR family transcriptional regulator